MEQLVHAHKQHWGWCKMEQIAQIVAQLGFPIALAIWLLVKDSKQAERAQSQWNEIKEALNRQTDTLNDISSFIKYGTRPQGTGSGPEDKDQKY